MVKSSWTRDGQACRAVGKGGHVDLLAGVQNLRVNAFYALADLTQLDFAGRHCSQLARA